MEYQEAKDQLAKDQLAYAKLERQNIEDSLIMCAEFWCNIQKSIDEATMLLIMEDDKITESQKVDAIMLFVNPQDISLQMGMPGMGEWKGDSHRRAQLASLVKEAALWGVRNAFA